MRRIRNRRLTAAVQRHFDTITRPTLAPAGVVTMLTARFPAYVAGGWHFNTHTKQHVIEISNSLANTNNKGGSLLNYYRAVINHETAHALFSERDEAKVRSYGPAYIVNVFEDARIEHAWRKSKCAITGRARPRFRWSNYNQFCTIDQGHSDPTSVFLDYILCDGSPSLAKEVNAYLASRGMASVANRVLEYYRRVCKCKTTADLEPIVKEWCDEFGASATAGGSTSHGGSASGASAGAGGMGGAGAGGAGAGGMGGGAAGGASSGGGGGGAHYVPTPPDRAHMSRDHYYPTAGGSTWKVSEENDKKALTVVHAMEAAFRVGNHTRFTQAPTGRISVRHVVANLPNIYKKHVHTGNDSPMSIRIIVDTSGSMIGPVGAELGGFIEGLCAMHESGRIKLDMWLSGQSSYSHIENPRREDAHFIYCGGGNEFIHGTMKASNAWKPAKDYDAVIVVTDGQITDGSVKRDDFSGQNNTLCVYVPDGGTIQPAILTRMSEQFPHAVYRNDAQSLAGAVAGTLSAWRASGMMQKQV